MLDDMTGMVEADAESELDRLVQEKREADLRFLRDIEPKRRELNISDAELIRSR